MELYNKLYKAINEGLAKSLNILHIDDEDNKVTYQHSKANTYLDPLQYEFIDLELPSGTLWCDHNLGADCTDVPESWYGDYYAWGEIETKNDYSWKAYKHSDDEGKTFYRYNTKSEKGNVDDLIILLPEDDIAHIEYSKIQNSEISKKVKMPTKEQLEELLEYTNNKWIKNYKSIKGLNGRIFIGSNGNSIFIPAAGYFFNSELKKIGSISRLWSNSLDSNQPYRSWCLYSYSDDIDFIDLGRRDGFPVRGVCSKN